MAAAAEVSLDKVESTDDKSTHSSSLSQFKSTVEATSRDNTAASVRDERDRLTFHIALGESGFASLGISVTKVFRNRQDCGIFIKSVRVGGMAAKVQFPDAYAVLFFIITYAQYALLCVFSSYLSYFL